VGWIVKQFNVSRASKKVKKNILKRKTVSGVAE
jgi:hypothetical protein